MKIFRDRDYPHDHLGRQMIPLQAELLQFAAGTVGNKKARIRGQQMDERLTYNGVNPISAACPRCAHPFLHLVIINQEGRNVWTCEACDYAQGLRGTAWLTRYFHTVAVYVAQDVYDEAMRGTVRQVESAVAAL